MMAIKTRTKVAIVGTGAIGGYVGAQMARAGEDVTLIDMWPANVEALRKEGMHLTGQTPAETLTVPVRALHISDVQSLAKEGAIDVAFVSTKSYDTEWATRLIKPYLAPNGFVVSMQNCINEETIASVVGWGKTLGVAISLLAAEMIGPGRVQRNSPLGGEDYVCFRVGETHGRVTARAEEVARLMRSADSVKVTTNLWGERWSKLCVNAMRNGLSAATGLGGNQREANEGTRWLGIRLGSEAIRVGQALGFELEKIAKIEPETLARAGEGDRAAIDHATKVLLEESAHRSDDQRPSMAQDMAKGRRTETDYINGYIAVKGQEIGVPAPTHAKLNDIVKRVERGELKPGVDTVRDLIVEVRGRMGGVAVPAG